jgi:phage/plasmid-associated DNA primase
VHQELGLQASDDMLSRLHDCIAEGSQLDGAIYLADQVCPEYRYGQDKQQKTSTLYRLSGPLWRPEQARHNLKGATRDLGLRVVKALLREKCWNPKEVAKLKEGAKEAKKHKKQKSDEESDGEDPAAAAAAAEAAAAAAEVNERNAKFSEELTACQATLQRTHSFDQLFAQLTERLQMDTQFLEPRGLPSPPDFFEMLDKKHNALGFTNGVIVLDGEAIRFYRSGEALPPDLHISMSTKYAFQGTADGEPETAADAAAMAELESLIFDKTFTDPEQRAAFKVCAGSVLLGGSALYKSLLLLIGPGGHNGKSLLVKLFEYSLGEYFAEVPYQLLTHVKQDANGADPHLCRVTKMRLVVSHEGTSKAPLNATFVKTTTGGDGVVVRDLFGRAAATSFFPKLMVLANDVPKVTGNDKALLSRLHFFDFTSTFGDFLQDDPVKREFRKGDFDGLCAHFHANRRLLMLLLIKYYKDFARGDTSKTPFKLVPMSEHNQAAACFKEGTLKQRVAEWLWDNFVETDGDFHSKDKSQEQKKRTMMNFQHVWERFARNQEVKQDEDLRSTSKQEFERLLKELGVKFQTGVCNQYLKGVRKAVCLWHREE